MLLCTSAFPHTLSQKGLSNFVLNVLFHFTNSKISIQLQVEITEQNQRVAQICQMSQKRQCHKSQFRVRFTVFS